MMKKKTDKFITIILLLMLILTLSFIVNSQTSVIISMDDIQITKDNENWNALKISDVENLGSFSINLSWNPNVIDIIEINSNDFSLFSYINNDNGFANLTGYTIQGLNGSFELLDILFKAIGIAGSSSSLKITYCELLTADPKPNTINCNYNENITLITITKSIPNLNITPNANITVSSTKENINTTITFNASKSFDSDGTIISYTWDFDDGKTATGIKVDHVFLNPGKYHVILTVTDNNDTIDKDSVDIIISQVNNSQIKLEITGPTNGTKGLEYEFSIYCSNIENDTISYNIDWGDNIKDIKNITSNNSSFILNHTWTKAGRYIIKLSIDYNMRVSEITQYLVLIDAEELYYNDIDIGYVTDDNLDGVFDTFNNDKDLLKKISSENYLIDVDGDYIWDYIYNSEIGSVAEYKNTNKKTNNISNYDFIIIIGIVFIVFICVILFLLFKRKSKKQ